MSTPDHGRWGSGPAWAAAGIALLAAVGLLAGAAPAPAEEPTLVPFGSTWRYSDDGSDLGVAWRLPGFDDGSWAEGPAELGYGDGDEATVVSYGGDPANKHYTTYFRRAFEVSDPGAVAAVDLGVVRDDGVVVYLNGVEVLRDNLPTGSITASTRALAWETSETLPVTTSVPSSALVAGTNTIAVEIHQTWRASSDLSFDLELTVEITQPPTTTTTSTPTTTTTTTAPPSGSDEALLAVGDIAACGGSHPLVATVLDGEAGTFAPLGDLAYEDGTAAEFAQCYDPWFGAHKDRTRPAPGNHEYNTPGAANYFAYFGPSAGSPPSGYYSYEIGSWHVVALNSECFEVGGCGPSSPMYQWLEDDLAASEAPCVAAYWHRAWRSSESGYDNPGYLDPLVEMLVEEGVDVLLAGHSHTYERFARLDATGQPSTTGLRHFTVGTGGNNLRTFGPEVTGSEVRGNSAYGLLRLDLGPGGYTWQFLAGGGAGFTDSGSDSCTPTAAPATVSGGGPTCPLSGPGVINGTPGPDVIIGTAGPDRINGHGGADVIKGLSGNDLICGGSGGDTINGGPGGDEILGQGGADIINGNTGADAISGGGGADDLAGGTGDDTLLGRAGGDSIRGGFGADVGSGGGAGDAVSGGRGRDTMWGDAGGDEVRGGTGDDALDGGRGVDFGSGGPGTDSCTRFETRQRC